MSRALRIALIVCFALGGILLFLLATASANTRLLERHYPLLFGLSLLIVVTMAGFLVALILRVRRRMRAGVFGTQLMTKLAVSLGVIGIVPGLLVYLVSVQFLARSIDSWFDVRVDKALESGLTLGQSALDSMLADLSDKSRKMSRELVDVPDAQLRTELNRLRESAGAEDALVLTGAGKVLAASSIRLNQLLPDMPPQSTLSKARSTRYLATIEAGDPDPTPGAGGVRTAPIRLRVITALPGSGQSGDELRFLQLMAQVPEQLAQRADAVQLGYRDYQELSLARGGLRKIFGVTLTLTLLLALFSALAAALLISGYLAGPLRKLSQATKQVAEGDFSPVHESGQRDELGVLIQSFNAMTRQLNDARATVERNRAELERQKIFLEQVLSNLSAGVLVFDRHFVLTTVNRGASQILGAKPDIGLPLEAVPSLGGVATPIREAFAALPLQLPPRPGDDDALSWQRELKVHREVAGSSGNQAVLLVRGSTLPEPDAGHVLVFDDVTELLAAQRSVAWGEVARRLAHEIKNPLTPIQLSAERLERRLADKLSLDDAEMLVRCTGMIVTQVAALKRMVDEFRDYARMPPAKLVPIDLNRIVDDVMTLYPAVEDRAPIRVQLSPGLPNVLGDTTQLMQVIHNLVLNAQDALSGKIEGLVTVKTEPVVNAAGQTIAVRLIVADNGPGFPPETLPRAFEPYVTTKAKGTGLGLAIVKKIVDEHGARIGLSNRTDTQINARNGVSGAEVTVTFAKLELSDQN